MINREYIAHELYRAYCEAVGGKAFNGDPLPSAEEFFADPTKEKQANAWLAAADQAIMQLSAPEPSDFGWALRHIKGGAKLRRRGWNGSGQWVALSGTELRPARVPTENLWSPHSRAEAEAQGGSVEVLPAIILRNAQGQIVMGWTPSTGDVLASDWEIATTQEEALEEEIRNAVPLGKYITISTYVDAAGRRYQTPAGGSPLLESFYGGSKEDVIRKAVDMTPSGHTIYVPGGALVTHPDHVELRVLITKDTTPIDDDHDPKWEESRDCAEDPQV